MSKLRWAKPILRAPLGSCITDVERTALKRARKLGDTVEFEFNGRLFQVHPAGTVTEIGYVVHKKVSLAP